MSYVIAIPEVVTAAAADLAGIGSTIEGANAAAAGPTTNLLAAAEDEVSTAIAALFGTHAREFQALSAQAAAFHNQFTQALSAGAGSYSLAEAANASSLQTLLNDGEYAHRGAARAPADRQRRRRGPGDRASRWGRWAADWQRRQRRVGCPRSGRRCRRGSRAVRPRWFRRGRRVLIDRHRRYRRGRRKRRVADRQRRSRRAGGAATGATGTAAPAGPAADTAGAECGSGGSGGYRFDARGRPRAGNGGAGGAAGNGAAGGNGGNGVTGTAGVAGSNTYGTGIGAGQNGGGAAGHAGLIGAGGAATAGPAGTPERRPRWDRRRRWWRRQRPVHRQRWGRWRRRHRRGRHSARRHRGTGGAGGARRRPCIGYGEHGGAGGTDMPAPDRNGGLGSWLFTQRRSHRLSGVHARHRHPCGTGGNGGTPGNGGAGVASGTNG